MKKLLPLFAATVLVAPAFAASFEGKVTMKMTGPKNAPPTMTFSLKEGFTRIDMTGGDGRNAGIIFDAAKQEMTILMLDQKMYMTQAMPKPPASGAGVGAEGAAGTGTAVDVTTTKEKILGYDCVKYVTQSKDGTTEIWVTDQLGPFLGFGGGPMGGGRRGPGGAAPAPQGWEDALSGKNVFPLRVVTTAGGKETFRLEATAIDKSSLPATLFYAPTDFRNLSDLMRGMGMPGGIPGMPGGMKPPGGE
jgi:hypothetical protein